MNELVWGRPAGGREPAGAALLAWLADRDAPRLCLLTGSEGCGKSALLAWLVAHGSLPGNREHRRVHGFVPLAGQSATTVAWTLAEELSVAARTPGELVSVLGLDTRRTVLVLPDLHAAGDPEGVGELVVHLVRHDHIRLVVEVRSGAWDVSSLLALGPAVMDLDDQQWTDAARRAASEATISALAAGAGVTTVEPSAGDLDDPAAVCTSEPWQISRLYEQSQEAHGGLRAAWLRAGGSLVRDQSPADRALTLLAALGDDADPRLYEQLGALASGAAWHLLWRRVRGDITPPWPGPARALAAGRSRDASSLLVADHQGTVRILDIRNGGPRGRLLAAAEGARSVTACPGGSALVVDGQGQLSLQRSPAEPKPTGIRALLDDGPGALERLVEAASLRIRGHSAATSVASAESVLAVADRSGSVHAYALEGGQEWHRAERLHTGGVADVAVLELPTADGHGRAPLIYSGGVDGRVRVWQPSTDPLAAPVAMRPCPVAALDALHTVEFGPVLAIGWADGLVEYLFLDTGQVHVFRPGPAVQAVALLHDGGLVVGTDETLACLLPGMPPTERGSM